MEATELLMSEHRVIEKVLDALDVALEKISVGRIVRPEFFPDTVDFIRHFADEYHHRKEEAVLFNAMVAARLPRDAGPIALMIYEHERSRKFTNAMNEAAVAWIGGDKTAYKRVIQFGEYYVNLLRQHIAKEDRIVFNLAEKVLSGDQKSQIYEDFLKIDKDPLEVAVNSRYRALAETLAGEMKI